MTTAANLVNGENRPTKRAISIVTLQERRHNRSYLFIYLFILITRSFVWVSIDIFPEVLILNITLKPPARASTPTRRLVRRGFFRTNHSPAAVNRCSVEDEAASFVLVLRVLGTQHNNINIEFKCCRRY